MNLSDEQIDAVFDRFEEAPTLEYRYLVARAILAAASPPAIPEGWKLLKDSTYEERSWPEDSSHENGNYSCRCYHCDRMFTGHKRRACCKVCAAAPAAPEAGLNPSVHPSTTSTKFPDAADGGSGKGGA